MKTYLDIRVCGPDGAPALRTVYQSPEVMRAGVLPFAASDGLTVVAASPSGEPSVRSRGGRTTVFLRTRACPLAKWGADAPVLADDARQAARATALAVTELRSALRARELGKTGQEGGK